MCDDPTEQRVELRSTSTNAIEWSSIDIYPTSTEKQQGRDTSASCSKERARSSRRVPETVYGTQYYSSGVQRREEVPSNLYACAGLIDVCGWRRGMGVATWSPHPRRPPLPVVD
jgi:hypothetical protein